MRKLQIIIVLFLGFHGLLIAQEMEFSDTKYREDQFYFGVTYNLLKEMPADMAQYGFSSGFHLGFIRDLPINDLRNVALGIGIGLSSNAVNHNLKISEVEQGTLNYSLVENGSFTVNKFSQFLIEVPFEFRWRTSTPETYKFWRVYSGFKLGYVLSSSVKFKGDPNNYKLKNPDDFNSFQYGITLSAGYDKFNVHFYYALNSIFKDNANIDSKKLNISLIKIGLMLYIL
jgi:hypothetical protein